MFGLGAGELFLIFMIAILFLGPKKIPELAKGLGQAIREFEKAKHEMQAEMNKAPDAQHPGPHLQPENLADIAPLKENPKAS